MEWEEEEEPDEGCIFHTSTYVDPNGQLQVTKVPVVQELARRGGRDLVPARFKLPENQRVISSSEAHIPTISLAKLGDCKAQDEELAKLRRGAEEWGMFLITDHVIESRMVGKVKEVVKGFFDLPFQAKKDSVGTHNSVDNMGYGRNFLKLGKPVDWIDRLTMKAAPAEAVDSTVWPLRPPCFRYCVKLIALLIALSGLLDLLLQACSGALRPPIVSCRDAFCWEVIQTYVVEARKVLDEILKFLEQALGLKKDTFMRYFDPAKSEINVRINYYPPCPSPESVLGITPHSDISTLTLLMESEASGGLQVMSRESNNWLTVTWPKDMLLVSAGDLLEIMSNGGIQSPWHRVVAHRSVERFSVALFYNPSAEAEIEPASGSEEGSAKYRSIVVKDYLRHYYDIVPTPDKQAIKYARLHH